MSIIGIRASSQEIRYAILELDSNGNIVFINANTEHRIKYPATTNSIEEKLLWVKSEIERVLRIHTNIQKIYLKTNEYGTESTAKREAAYTDAMFLLTAKEHNIPIVRKIYSQISSSSSQAKMHAEQRVGRTEKYWNSTMADAILVAYWGLKFDV